MQWRRIEQAIKGMRAHTVVGLLTSTLMVAIPVGCNASMMPALIPFVSVPSPAIPKRIQPITALLVYT